ncbi:MAG: putative glycosyltransferase [Frankiales bacterium]|nr:putative glycosyltransferase [Frankiales bacterium]
MRPAVDVLVVTHGTAELTADALRRLLDSEQGVDLRVLVHDNASSDDTVAVLAARVPEAEVVAAPVNAGFAAGVNALVARSSAPWLLVLNSDAWPAPGAVGELVAALQAAPLAGLSAPRLESPDGDLELSAFPFPSVLGAVRAALLREPHPFAPAEVDWVVGACWLVRREAALDAGPLDESLFMYGEDVAWCWALRQAGWRVRYEPSALVVHVGNASGRAAYDDTARTRAWVGNDLRLYPRWGRAPRLYRWVRVLGALRASRLAYDEGTAAHWRTVARAYRLG